jgi:hypothetical protein
MKLQDADGRGLTVRRAYRHLPRRLRSRRLEAGDLGIPSQPSSENGQPVCPPRMASKRYRYVRRERGPLCDTDCGIIDEPLDVRWSRDLRDLTEIQGAGGDSRQMYMMPLAFW